MKKVLELCAAPGASPAQTHSAGFKDTVTPEGVPLIFKDVSTVGRKIRSGRFHG